MLHMVQIGCLKKFLKMIFRVPCLALKVTLSGHDIFLIGVICFLVAVSATNSNCDPPVTSHP
jgi:hypothetical protein